MPEDENNCPTCPPTGKTIIPAVRNDVPPGTIPDEHLAILRANAAKPEVKARFTETMTSRVIGPIRTETPAFVPVRALVEMPHQMPEIPPLDATGAFAEEAIHPRRPSGEVVDMPARVNRGATYISLHAHTDLPDVGSPRYISQLTHSGNGISDVTTRAALAGLPLFRPSAGSLQFTNEACEDIGDYYWPEDDPGPSDKELNAVMKFVEDNFDTIRVGDFIEVTIEPEGTVVYWQYEGAMNVPPACQNLHRFKRLATRPPKLTLDLARRTGRVHKITAGGVAAVPEDTVAEDGGGDHGRDEEQPPPERRQPGALPEPERPRPAPPPGGGLTGSPTLPRPSLGKSKPVPDEERDKYGPVPLVSPCSEKIFAKEDFSGEIVVAVFTTREKPFRRASEPSDAEKATLFEKELESIQKQAENYVGGLATLEGLEATADTLATCDDPDCPNVQSLSVEGWGLTSISNPAVSAAYSSRPVGDPSSPRGHMVAATFSVKAYVVGTIWFSYWCV